MCPAATIENIYGVNGADWKTSAYNTLSIASQLSGAIQKHTAHLKLLACVWKLDRALRRFLEDIYKATENPVVAPVEPVTEDQIREAADICLKIHRDIDNVFTRAKRMGLTNSTVIGAGFNSVKVRSEDILDIGDALALSINPRVDAVFERSLEDLRRGEVYDLPI